MIRTNQIIILILLVFLSCTNKKKDLEQKNEYKLKKRVLKKIINNSENTNHFVVTLDVLANKDDSFQLFYTEDYMLTFLEKQSIILDYKGSNTFQKIVFHLPKNVKPDRFRIDVGSNMKQKQLTIKSLTLSYNKNKIEITKYLIPEYIIPNAYIKYDPETYVYYLNAINYEGHFSFDPYFLCSPKLIRLLLDL